MFLISSGGQIDSLSDRFGLITAICNIWEII